MKLRSLLRGAVPWAYALCCAASCRQLLGIEDAETDPTLSKTSGSQGSSGGEAGSDLPGGVDGAGREAGTGGVAASTGGVAAGIAGAGGESEAAGQSGEAGRAGEPGQTESVCERYCDAVMSNCTGSFAVYTSRETCLAVCAYLPEGQPGDRDVDSVQCRLRAATIAPDEVPHYCPIAGPGGNGGCGSNCESLCALREGVCADFITTDEAVCLKHCKSLDDLGTFSVDLSAEQYQGPHVQCRLYHVSAAATDDAEQHCLHVDGAAPCQGGSE